jgi:PAP2 superfamily
MKKFLVRFVFIAFVAFVWSGCDRTESVETPLASDFESRLANEYFDLAMKLTRETPGFSPPVAARAYAYTGLALYESVVGGMPDHRSLQGTVNGLLLNSLPTPETGLEYHWGLVASSALSEAMLKLYKTASLDNLKLIVDLKQKYELEFNPRVSLEVIQRSRAFGEEMGREVYLISASDGQDEASKNNFPAIDMPEFPGAWIPTPPTFQKPLQPYWGAVRPFVKANVEQIQPPAPPLYSTEPTSRFYAQALEVYSVASNLTPAQQTIAEYWSDDSGKTATPPGHSISIAKQVLEIEKADLAKAAEAYAKVGMAVHDAFVSCWKYKYEHNLMRPITYIRAQFKPGFNTLLSTPPFPEYPSGHSVQSGASAVVLSELFGYGYKFTDRTHEKRTDINGAPRAFNSFMEAADEAAISRLYGGIHYRAGIELGLDQGKKIGKNISAIPFKK